MFEPRLTPPPDVEVMYGVMMAMICGLGALVMFQSRGRMMKEGCKGEGDVRNSTAN